MPSKFDNCENSDVCFSMKFCKVLSLPPFFSQVPASQEEKYKQSFSKGFPSPKILLQLGCKQKEFNPQQTPALICYATTTHRLRWLFFWEFLTIMVDFASSSFIFQINQFYMLCRAQIMMTYLGGFNNHNGFCIVIFYFHSTFDESSSPICGDHSIL